MGLVIDGKEFSDTEVKALEKAGVLTITRKNDPGSTTLTATPLHGAFHGNANQFGIFSSADVRPERFSALVRPTSMISVIPFLKSEYINEAVEIKTGQTAGTGNNATTFCGNPPVYGQLKTCKQNYTYGDIYAKTQLNDLTQVGALRNRGEVTGRIYNEAAVNNPFLPQVEGITGINDTRSQVQNEFYTFGVGLEREVAQVHWLGTAGTQNSTYRGIMTQWAGLDGQIKTGYTDTTGVTCPAADSVVSSFNVNITSTDSNGADFVEAMHDVWRAVTMIAHDVGMDGVQWVWVLRPEHFIRATDVFSCAYATYRCKDGAAGSPVNRDGSQQQALRVQMLNGKYLLMDGLEVPVIEDRGILRETIANNTYKSDAYLVPLSWNGIPLLYYQYFDMGNSYAQELAEFLQNDTRVINNGLYRVAKRTTGLCLEYLFAGKVRLILDTPFLAGRLDDTQYTYFVKSRDAIPGASLYADGGVTYRS